MKDENQKIIYIGKAKNLKNRVNSYFNNNIDNNSKVGKLVKKINNIDYIITNNELEALILESNLIKKHKPIYNILLKDDKGYKFIKISPGPYSKISIVNKKQDDKSFYIGPYMSNFMANEIVNTLNKTFKLPTCNRELFKQNKYKRPCLNYYINICSAPCCNYISVSEYQDIINQAKQYLKSGIKPIIKNLKNKMITESQNLNFEEAAKIRDKIKSLEKINISNNVIISKYKNIDVLAVVMYQNYICGTILIFRDYKLLDKIQYLVSSEIYEFAEFSENELSEVRKTMLLENYILSNNNFNNFPEFICLDAPPQDFELIQNYISQNTININIIYNNHNQELSHIIEIAKNNSKERILQEIKLINKEIVYLNKLKILLNLKKIPRKIEAYDISNFGSQIIVGAMISIIDGTFKKSEYRKFKIKNINNQDDYQSMSQIITRRLNRYNLNLKTNQQDESFSKLPDLILIDGGYNHIAIVNNILKNFNLNIPIYGMVKDNKHETNALINLQKQKIEIQNDKDLFLFIKRIQDEIHRFTISYSRKLYNKNLF